MDYSRKFSLWLYWLNQELLLSVGGRFLIFSNTRQQVVAVHETFRWLVDFLVLMTCKTLLDTDYATQ